ncbi:uncharacterized protein [Arachis hypogaea]|uniref:uncharacterized protein n=1 Tax=Arachis hypogaea TaxID=3818 RepID=UPI000DECC0D1|nr:uncharacterized protein LOC112803976 [Arachis hypogaea]
MVYLNFSYRAESAVSTSNSLTLSPSFSSSSTATTSKKQNNKEKEKPIKIQHFHYSDLEAATNSFSERKLFGKGSHGYVYKAVMVSSSSFASAPEFIISNNEVDNEIDILSKIQSNNSKLPNWGRRVRLALQTAKKIDTLHSSTPLCFVSPSSPSLIFVVAAAAPPPSSSSSAVYSVKQLIRGGGIHRFKLHLAGKGGDIESCRKVPAVVRHRFHQSIEELRSKKRKTQEQYAESYNACDEVEREFDEIEPTTPKAQPTIKNVLQSKEIVENCDIAVAKWMMDAFVPFNAVNSAYYQPMIDAIASMGAGYKGPNYPRVCGYLLSKLVEDVRKIIDGYRTIFLKSVDAFNVSKTADVLFKLFRDVVLFVGLENVVHIVTENAANYVAAGKLLEAEFPKLYWSPCVSHSVNLMFQDIGKLQEVSEIVSQASIITKYIYNHCYPLFLMRKFTGRRKILHPAPTQFATIFIALQSILAQKDPLRAMVTSKEWTSSTYSKEAKAKIFVDQVLNSEFWSQCTDIVKLTEPLVRVLRIVDNKDRAAMGFLYQAIYKAKEEMVKRFQKRKKVVDPYLKILETRWNAQLKKNLHAAGYWLNRAFRFNAEEFEKHKQTTSGLLDVID